jgi:putative DNA primase/helicase
MTGSATELKVKVPEVEPEADAPPDAEGAARELAKLSMLKYDQCREKEAKRLNVRVKTLDDAVRRHRVEEEAQETFLSFTSVEPSAEPVDGAGLLEDIAETLRRYVVLPDHAAEQVAPWIMFAWAFDAWTIAPMIQISAPERACGKTRLLEVIGALVPKPLPTGSISTAALFRVIEALGPSLLVDEAETFLTDNPELVGVLNNGYSRHQAFVVRCVGDDHDVKQFRVWGPKVLCGIGELSDTLASRCITIQMRRKRAGESVERLRADRQHWAEALRSHCARWAADNIECLRNGDPEMPKVLDDRAQDNWRPLIAIADLVGGDWPVRARAAAIALCAPRAGQEETKGILLLRAIREVFDQEDCETIASSLLVERLCALPDSPWSEWSQGKPISARTVARMSGGFGIAPQKGRQSSLYVKSDFEDAWSRYVPGEAPQVSSTTSTSSTPLKNKGNSVDDKTGVELASSTSVEVVDDSRSTLAPSSTENPIDINTVEDVEVVELLGGSDARDIRGVL